MYIHIYIYIYIYIERERERETQIPYYNRKSPIIYIFYVYTSAIERNPLLYHYIPYYLFHAISLTGKLISAGSGRVYNGRCRQPPRLAQVSLVS